MPCNASKSRFVLLVIKFDLLALFLFQHFCILLMKASRAHDLNIITSLETRLMGQTRVSDKILFVSEDARMLYLIAVYELEVDYVYAADRKYVRQDLVRRGHNILARNVNCS